MFLRFLIISTFLFLNFSQAAQKPQDAVVVVDELLFDLGGEGKTNYDFKIFEEVVKNMERYFPPNLLQSFHGNSEFYVFSCLALREAEELDIQADSEKVERFMQSNRFPKSEVENLFRVVELVTIKDRQLQNRQAIITWLVVLKRKYSLGWKSNDFKNRVGFGI